jgi:hypothetical protein
MKLKLPDTIASSQDLSGLVLEIKEFSRWFAHDAIKKQVSGKHADDRPSLTPAASELLREWESSKALTRERLDELTSGLEAYQKNSPTITFTLAAPATPSIKKTLVGWCRENIAPNILVSFQFNATLLGGMVVHRGSRVFDWSFRRSILAARESFPETLRRV